MTPMQKVREAARAGLTWSQSSALRMEYELRSGEALVGTLKFRSAWGTLATAESGDGCWTFKRIGFWQRKVSVRVCGSDVDLAVFTNDTWTNGGTLEFHGREYQATTNWWQTKLLFQIEEDKPLVRFHYGGVFRRSADVEITPAAREIEDVPILVMLGWYLAIMLDMDSSAGAVVATM